jgi:hypothetical protein
VKIKEGNKKIIIILIKKERSGVVGSASGPGSGPDATMTTFRGTPIRTIIKAPTRHMRLSGETIITNQGIIACLLRRLDVSREAVYLYYLMKFPRMESDVKKRKNINSPEE